MLQEPSLHIDAQMKEERGHRVTVQRLITSYFDVPEVSISMTIDPTPATPLVQRQITAFFPVDYMYRYRHLMHLSIDTNPTFHQSSSFSVTHVSETPRSQMGIGNWHWGRRHSIEESPVRFVSEPPSGLKTSQCPFDSPESSSGSILDMWDFHSIFYYCTI